MAQKLMKTQEYNAFPPEAEGDFDVVEQGKIAEWREKLNERFGIGQGKLEAIEEPSLAEA